MPVPERNGTLTPNAAGADADAGPDADVDADADADVGAGAELALESVLALRTGLDNRVVILRWTVPRGTSQTSWPPNPRAPA